MFDIRSLIPKHKTDVETALHLRGVKYEEIKPIVPDLLEWLQDVNWPVSRPVADYLKTIAPHIAPEILFVMRGNDDIWKYWCLSIFGEDLQGIDPLLTEEIKRIASNPSTGETEEGLQELAAEILGWKK